MDWRIIPIGTTAGRRSIYPQQQKDNMVRDPTNTQLLRETARRTPNLPISLNREQDQEITMQLQLRSSQPEGRTYGKPSSSNRDHLSSEH